MRCRWPDTPRRHLHAAGSPSCARAAAGDRSRPRRVVPRCRSPTDDARLRPLDGPGDLPAGGSWYSSPVQPAPCDSPEIRIGTRSSCRAAARCNPGLAECELDWLSRHQPTPRLARLRQILPVSPPLGQRPGLTDTIELPGLLRDDDIMPSRNDRLAPEPLAPAPNRGQRGTRDPQPPGSRAQNRSGTKVPRDPRPQRWRVGAPLRPPLALPAIGFERGQPRGAVSMSNRGSPSSLGESTR